jgi:phosphoribosylanthranilate isomerase
LFRIKICGVTTAKDAQVAALAGADAIGLNFFSRSKRFVEPAAAEKIVAGVPARVARVGIFVNNPPAEIIAIADQIKLDWIQLHGDETPATVKALSGRAVISAFRLGETGVAPVHEFLAACKELDVFPKALLFDVARPGEYGGTGHTLDWAAIGSVRDQFRQLPLVLAGGLTPFNVAEAVAAVRPDAVDVASGIEAKPGIKDMMLVRAFVQSAKKALGDPQNAASST